MKYEIILLDTSPQVVFTIALRPWQTAMVMSGRLAQMGRDKTKTFRLHVKRTIIKMIGIFKSRNGFLLRVNQELLFL